MEPKVGLLEEYELLFEEYEVLLGALFEVELVEYCVVVVVVTTVVVFVPFGWQVVVVVEVDLTYLGEPVST